MRSMSTAPSIVEPMLSLVYVSSAVEMFSEQELFEVLRVSRINNDKVGITGMLLYKDGNFMQALEGPESVVEGRLKVIARDPRHRNIMRLIKQKPPERLFPSWSMGFQNLTDVPSEDLDAFSAFTFNSLLDGTFQDNPANSYRLLRHFRHSMK